MSRADRVELIRSRQLLPGPGPEQVVIDLCNRCNNNCIACWTGSPLLRDQAPPPDWFEQELPMPLVTGLLHDLAAMDCEIVRYTGGGEPLLHPELADILQLTSDLGLSCHLTSNGTLLDRLEASALAAIDELTVSLWAATPETYSRLHPNKTGGTFTRITNTLRRLQAERQPELVIANVIGAMNHHELEAMLALAVELGAMRVYFAVVDPVPGCTEGLLLDNHTAAELEQRARELFEAYRGRITIDNESGFLRRLHENDPVAGSYDRNAVNEVPCLVGWFFARVMANGEVVPCCRAVMRPMGSLYQSRFAQIWTSAAWAELRRHADEPKSSPYYQGIGCLKTCDNLMHNLQWQREVSGDDGG
jgi:MoaA/NifB/PqqE/SkfB family radical SAM enzyme